MLTLDQIVIDPEFRDLLPAMDRRAELAAKIEAEGWSDEPITVWQHHAILLDGHNRYAIWQERGDDGPGIRELKFETREEAIHWAINNQWSRRNLTPEQSRFLLGRKYTAEKKIRGGDGSNQHARKQQMGENIPLAPGPRTTNPTAARIGKEHGVSDHKVKQAEKYANAVDKLDAEGVVSKADILSGSVKIPAAHVVKAAKASTPEEAKAVITESQNRKEAAKTSKQKKTGPAPSKGVGVGMQVANKCVAMLSQIPTNDPLRKRGFQFVMDWLTDKGITPNGV